MNQNMPLSKEIQTLLPELNTRFGRIFQMHWQLRTLISDVADQELLVLSTEELYSMFKEHPAQLDHLTSIKVLLNAIHEEVIWLKKQNITIKNLFQGELLIPTTKGTQKMQLLWTFGQKLSPYQEHNAQPND
jgi:hypothetical protein